MQNETASKSIGKSFSTPIRKSFSKPIRKSFQKSLTKPIRKSFSKPITTSLTKPITTSAKTPIQKSFQESLTITTTSTHISSDLAAIIAKYIPRTPKNEFLNKAYSDSKIQKVKLFSVKQKLEIFFENRKSLDLIKDIVSPNQLNFNKIHDSLKKIDFKKPKGSEIAPMIASKVKNLEFFFKKKLLSEKYQIE